MNSVKKSTGNKSKTERPKGHLNSNQLVYKKDVEKLQKAYIQLQNLSLAISATKINALEEAIEIIQKTTDESLLFSSNDKKNPNRLFLIGNLPGLFQDKELFPSNEDIVDFASAALELPINRAAKRSRYELIGLVICETLNISEDKLTNLVKALEKLVDNNEMLKITANKKQSASFSWNETLQELLRS